MTHTPSTPLAKLIACCFSVCTLLICSYAQPTPYIPVDGTRVVETLKKDARQRELQAMRLAVAANPNNISMVSELTQHYIAEARNSGDPRYLGYAQAALAPWWKQVDAPSQILVLRATLLQSTHQFAAALTDLDLVLKKDRNNAQAWLTKATVQQVLGKYAGAKASCQHLYSLTQQIIAETCINHIGSLSGEAEKSYAALARAYKNSTLTEPSIKIWVLTLLAEMSVRKADVNAAQTWFKLALELGEPDSYLLGAYADFLLDQGRDIEVIAMLKGKTRVDALLLRYAVALKRQKSPLAAEHASNLEQRFTAAMLREDTVHQREQARFELQIKNRPRAALALAQKNWAVQKESADLRIYLEAALACADRQAALPALEWLRTNQLEDQAIQALAKKLGMI